MRASPSPSASAPRAALPSRRSPIGSVSRCTSTSRRCRPSVPTGRDGRWRTHQPCRHRGGRAAGGGCCLGESCNSGGWLPAGYGEAVEQLLLSVTDLPELAQIDVDLGKAPPPSRSPDREPDSGAGAGHQGPPADGRRRRSNTRFWCCARASTAALRSLRHRPRRRARGVVTLARNLSQRAANPIAPGDPAQLRTALRSTAAAVCGARCRWRTASSGSTGTVRARWAPGPQRRFVPGWMLDLSERALASISASGCTSPRREARR